MNTQGLPEINLPQPPVLTEREHYVTEQVVLFLENDEQICAHARGVFTATGAEGLRALLVSVLRYAKKDTAAWHVSRELAVADYDRVCWPVVGDSITSP